MKIAIAQFNAIVGDMTGNANKIIALSKQAKQQGADLIITPELGLCGYPPEDLLFRQDFMIANQKAINRIAKSTPDITVLVGHPHNENKQLFNAASLLQDGKIKATYHKQILPNYSVFDEDRYFEPDTKSLVFELAGIKFGILICADGWEPAPAKKAKDAGAEFLLSLNASPYHMDKLETRYQVLIERVKETGLPLIYANLVGGQDELVFDGASFVLNAQGKVTHQLPAFVETLDYVVIADKQPVARPIIPALSLEAMVYNALKLGLADYVNKNGFPSVVLGLSGGIDSALTLAIAVDALGKDRVKVLMMSSQYTASISVDDAIAMAKLVDVDYSLIPIKSLFESFKQALSAEFKGREEDATEENLQARIRGMLLMALSNKYGSIVLTTGNKSETAVGYTTLYGDMAGGFALLKDVPKTLVYRLANYRNSLSTIIPERIITRPPSAELRDNQTDQDSLPSYEILDAIMQAYVEDDLSPDDIIKLGYREADVKCVIKLIDKNEYKRRQAPIGVRITQRGFGKDRRYPITCKLNFN
ncbi:MAG: NAD+ synthase [Methylophilaceae bacterium]|nr:MAG: NAD+ synthase [Methylophilaceae bacterium]